MSEKLGSISKTQKRNPKQTHASEGSIKFCANHRGHNNLKFQAQASARGLPKHSWNQPANDQCSNNLSGAQFHGIKRLKTVGSPLSQELGDAKRVTAAHIIVKAYKMHAKMKYRNKKWGRD